jgi:hypothetical protein
MQVTCVFSLGTCGFKFIPGRYHAAMRSAGYIQSMQPYNTITTGAPEAGTHIRMFLLVYLHYCFCAHIEHCYFWIFFYQ